jgi:hypothetical protein
VCLSMSRLTKQVLSSGRNTPVSNKGEGLGGEWRDRESERIHAPMPFLFKLEKRNIQLCQLFSCF